MTNITLPIKKQSPVNNICVDKLLQHLFADKRSIYIDDINFSSDGGYDVSWCMEFTLKMNQPQWMDTHLERHTLLSFIRAEKLNYWEAYRYDSYSGSVQPYTNVAHDLEAFLDEQYQEVIQRYMEEVGS
jgi:6-phosphogluconolactonase (cycloisomerase 2 family)